MDENKSTLRIALTADLHCGITSEKTIADLVERIAAEKCDLVLIAGDIGEPDRNFRAALRLFGGLDIPRALVAGNHDLWAGDYPSRYLWDDVLPHVAEQNGFVWLDAENIILAPFGICGTIGWYDYSAKDPHLADYDNDRYAKEKAQFNYDAIKIDWPTSDRDFAAEVLAGFRARISALQKDRQIAQIAVLTHVPPFEEQIIRKPPDDFMWNVNNAYFGNLTLGREIQQYDKVRLVVSGHTHVGIDTRISHRAPLTENSMRIVTIGSQYFHPQLQFIDLSV